MTHKQAALAERVSVELAKETGELERVKDRLIEEVANFESSYCIKEDSGAALALAKEYRVNRERIRMLLREKAITPDEASRLLSALNLARNRCC